jgi:hypothetical protein
MWSSFSLICFRVTLWTVAFFVILPIAYYILIITAPLPPEAPEINPPSAEPEPPPPPPKAPPPPPLLFLEPFTAPTEPFEEVPEVSEPFTAGEDCPPPLPPEE